MNGGKWVAKYGKNVAPGKMQKSGKAGQGHCQIFS